MEFVDKLFMLALDLFHIRKKIEKRDEGPKILKSSYPEGYIPVKKDEDRTRN